MPTEQYIVLFILVGAVLLFVIDRIRADVVALLVLVSLVLTGLLTPEEAFAGLASPAVITVFGVFIISGAFTKSGFTDSLARQLARFSGKGHRRLVFIIMITVGVVSGFMNNIGAVAIFMPAVITVCRRRGISPSKLLMPMAFAALLGGNLTLIGTPPNLLAVDILQKYDDIPNFEFFDFFPTGLLVLFMGIGYMYFLASA